MAELTEILNGSEGMSLDGSQPRFYRSITHPIYRPDQTSVAIYSRDTVVSYEREFQTADYTIAAQVDTGEGSETTRHFFKEGYVLLYNPDNGSYRFEITPAPAVDFRVFDSLSAAEGERFAAALTTATPQLVVQNDFDNPHDLDVSLWVANGTQELFRTNSATRYANCRQDFMVWFDEVNKQNVLLAEYNDYLKTVTPKGLDVYIARIKASIPEPNLGTQKQFEELAKRAQTSRVPIRDVTSLIPAQLELVPFASF